MIHTSWRTGTVEPVVREDDRLALEDGEAS
jgi:hypothetical protein